MVSRGIRQLQNLKIIYSDMDGSSKGIRELLKSEVMVNFVKGLPTVQFEFLVKRGSHPLVVSRYVNGYTKTVCLRNLSQNDLLFHLSRCGNESILLVKTQGNSRTFSISTRRESSNYIQAEHSGNVQK